jgi:nucleoredoxin
MSSSTSWRELFGNLLVGQNGQTVSTAEALADKVVMIYFSAHWCPPCRGFTPQLVEFYNNNKGIKNFEIVFVSSDRDESGFQEYFGEMPWLALPFSERDTKTKLSSLFRVSGIPSLVVMDSNCSLITRDGRSIVQNDPVCEKFPWRPRAYSEVLGDTFIGQNGSTVTRQELGGKYVGLYFSAHWCPPCKSFTPKLVKYYNARKEKGDFEVIFCSGDRAQEQFDEYFGTMPWLSFPFKDSRIEELNAMYEIEGIPTLVIVDPDGNVVTTKGRAGVESDPAGKDFPYHPSPIEDLSVSPEAYGFDINEKPSFILFMEAADDGDQSDAKEALLPFAKELAEEKAKSLAGPDMLFFTCFGPNEIGGKVRSLMGMETAEQSTNPQMAILDIPDRGGFYMSDATEITTATIGKFIGDFKTKSIKRKQLGGGSS